MTHEVEEDVSNLLSQLGHANNEVAADVISALTDLGSSVVEALIVLLSNPDGRLRARASRTLERIGDPRGIDAIAQLYWRLAEKADCEEERRDLAYLLSRVDEPTAHRVSFNFFLGLFKQDPDLEALQYMPIRHPPAQAWLKAATQHPSPEVRRAAERRLAGSEPWIVESPRDRSFAERRSHPPIEELLVRFRAKRNDEETIEALGESGHPHATTAILEYYQSLRPPPGQHRLRRALVWALRRLGEARALPLLREVERTDRCESDDCGAGVGVSVADVAHTAVELIEWRLWKGLPVAAEQPLDTIFATVSSRLSAPGVPGIVAQEDCGSMYPSLWYTYSPVGAAAVGIWGLVRAEAPAVEVFPNGYLWLGNA